MTTDPDAAAALEQLIDQFTDPLAFYRELIQNAIDAGSAEVEVSLDFDDGVITIHVNDWGEGMNREIIDSRLTRLFSSRKDGDLTKIGKFGIGFVSVFAIDPDAVIVDTTREDESWRILFNRDRSFERIRRDEPGEGTRIRILKGGTKQEYDDLLNRTVEVIRFWCRFVDAQIRVQGELINQPFVLNSPCQVSWAEEGTRIVVGLPEGGPARLGFYNRGLTLKEEEAPSWQRASVMINSRHLEHTLARDDVRQDDGFFKVMHQAERLIGKELPERLAEELRAALASGAADERTALLYRHLARWLEPALVWSWPAAKLSHGGGHAEGDAWVAIAGSDRLTRAAHLVYGPYIKDVPPGEYRVSWRLAVEDEPGPARGKVATLDINDAAADRILERRRISRRHFGASGEYRTFDLFFTAREGQKLEFRTLWHKAVTLRQTTVTLSGGDRIDPRRSAFAGLELFQSPAGARLSLGQAAQAASSGEVLVASEPSDLVQALQTAGKLVILAEPGSCEWRLLEAMLSEPPVLAGQRYCMPLPCREGEAQESGWTALRAALGPLLDEHGARVAGTELGRFEPGFPIAEWAAIAQEEPFALSEVAEVGRVGSGLFAPSRTLVVNRDHPTVEHLLAVALFEPELAAYLLLKLFGLRGSMDAAIDSALAGSAWEARWTRLTC